ncbi:hypothetical protein ccbrp13_64140 [Ktedonobacteria bacterium brp13]|nr:hypothetical protein ccbrp13_64140 [Ktedonobacteria bacterium brp13]
MGLIPQRKRPHAEKQKPLDRLANSFPDRLTNRFTNEPAIKPLTHSPRRRLQLPSQPLSIILCILALLAVAHLIAVMRTTPVQDQLNTPSCANYLLRLDYTKIVTLQAGQQLAAVQLINNVVGGQPATLIQVDENDTQQKVDAYIYRCTMQHGIPELSLLFKQQGLIQGSVEVTTAHTLSIGQLDTTLKPDAGAMLLVPQQQNIYREYAWQNATFQQVIFPGIYPVVSRSEATAMQDEANDGQMVPWNDPLATAEQMAQDLFHWQNSKINGTVQDNNGVDAHVLIERKDTRLQVQVSLSRLIQHDSHGLWFVTGAQTPGISLDQTQFSSVLTSPLKLQGSITSTNDPISITLFDHTLSPLHIREGDQIHANNDGTFKGNVIYDNGSLFPNQTCLLLLQTTPAADSKDVGYLYLTNLFLH